MEHRRLRLNASALELLEAGVMPAHRQDSCQGWKLMIGANGPTEQSLSTFPEVPRLPGTSLHFPCLDVEFFFGEVTREGETQNYGPAARALEGRNEWRD